MTRMHWRAQMVAAAVCSVVLALSGCGTQSAADGSSNATAAVSASASATPQGPTIAIGVSSDLPGLGYRHEGGYVGFDIDVAAYVANALGYGDKQIVFTPVAPSERAAALERGDVDMVVAAFGMDERNEREVTFAGPYLTVHPSVLTRGDSRAASTDGTGDAGGAVDADDGGDAGDGVTCVVRGTIMQERLGSGDALRSYDTYGQCMTALMVGSVDGIAADDAILPGLSRNHRGTYRIESIEAAFAGSDAGVDAGSADAIGYGVAVRRGRVELASKIAGDLRAMIEDGTWRSYVDANLTPLGYALSQPPAADAVAVH